MDAVYWILGVSAVIVVALVLASAYWKESRALEAAKDWQTLIGAVLGFAAVAISILMQGAVMRAEEQEKQLNFEIAVLQNGYVDLHGALGTVTTMNDLLLATDAQNWSSAECAYALRTIKTNPVRQISASGQMSVLSSRLSVHPYVAIAAPVDGIHRLQQGMAGLDTTDCATSPNEVGVFLIDQTSMAMAEFANYQMTINDLVDTLQEISVEQ